MVILKNGLIHCEWQQIFDLWGPGVGGEMEGWIVGMVEDGELI